MRSIDEAAIANTLIQIILSAKEEWMIDRAKEILRPRECFELERRVVIFKGEEERG